MYPWLCITDDRKKVKPKKGGDDDSVCSARTAVSENDSVTAENTVWRIEIKFLVINIESLIIF